MRGAPLIGIAAAYGMAIAVRSKSIDLNRAAEILTSARPTAVNLKWAVSRVMSKKNILAEAEKIHREDRILCERISKNGMRLVKKHSNIITICNTGFLATGGCGTAFGVICKAREKISNLFVLETRPLMQGSRLTMWEAEKLGIKATLICDSAIGHVFKTYKIDIVFTGADRIALNGDIANKIGTFTLAIMAKKFRVPFYVCAPYSTFDSKIKSGNDIPIEVRSKKELSQNCESYNPAFDITPAKYISGFITNKGVLNPPF